MNKTYEELQDELHMCHEALAEAHEREQALRSALVKIDKDLETRNFLESSSLRDTARAALGNL